MSGSITTSPMASPGARPPITAVPLQQLPSSPSIGTMHPPGSPRSEAPSSRMLFHTLCHSLTPVSCTAGLSGDRSDHSGMISALHFNLGSAHSRDDFESTPIHSLTTPVHIGSVRSHASSAVQSRSAARVFLHSFDNTFAERIRFSSIILKWQKLWSRCAPEKAKAFWQLSFARIIGG
jgi:hypothetical protein